MTRPWLGMIRLAGACAAAMATAIAGEAAPEGTIMIPLAGPVVSNIPGIERCLSGGHFVFHTADAAPAAAPGFFFVRFTVQVPEAGDYRLAVRGQGPGSRGQSRYSYLLDNGPAREMLSRRVVTFENGRGSGWHDQPPVSLAKGEHTLEFRFLPDQRVRLMNRVDAPWQGHAVDIDGLRLVRVGNTPARARLDTSTPQLQRGDTLVFFGDSITDEGFYPRHVARLLAAAWPEKAVTCINAGIGMNRTWEALERLDRDVIALRPDWVVLAFGVNDSVHMSPDEFAEHYEAIIKRLTAAGIRVLCTTPSGMLPELGTGDTSYFHAPDRAAAFDRTQIYESAHIVRLAAQQHGAFADILGALCHSTVPRAKLMGSQWHPNDEGGRVMALTILRTLGFSEADAARTGDALDVTAYRAIAAMPVPAYDTLVAAKPAAVKPFTGALLAATSFSRNEVAFFAAATGEELARVPVGHHPVGVAWSAKRQRLYVACEGSGRLDVIKVPGFVAEAPIPLGDVYPVAVVLSDDEATAWTGNFFGCSVSEIDLATGKVRREAKLGDVVESLIRVPGQQLLAATRKGVMLVDPAVASITKTLLLTPHNDAFYRDAAGAVFAIDTVTWQMQRLALPELTAAAAEPCPWRSRAALLDPATGARWVSDWRTGTLTRTGGEAVPAVVIPRVEFCFGLTLIPAR